MQKSKILHRERPIDPTALFVALALLLITDFTETAAPLPAGGLAYDNVLSHA